MKRIPLGRGVAAFAIIFLLISLTAVTQRPEQATASADSTTTSAATTTEQIPATTAETTTITFAVDSRTAVTDDDPWREVCDDVEGDYPHYFAQTPNLPTGYFGPEVKASSTQEALNELHRRMCLDPMLAAVVSRTFYGVFDDTLEVNEMIDIFLADREIWLQSVYWFESIVAGTKVLANDVGVIQVEIIDVGVEEALTQVVRLRPGLPPLIQLDNEHKLRYFALRFTFSDSAVVDLQLNCGFQPTVLDKGTILDTPVPPVTVTTAPPTTTTSTTTTQPSTTTTTKPTTTTTVVATTTTTKPTTTTSSTTTTTKPTTTTTSTTTTTAPTTTSTKPPEPTCDPATRPPWDPCP